MFDYGSEAINRMTVVTREQEYIPISQQEGTGFLSREEAKAATATIARITMTERMSNELYTKKKIWMALGIN